MHCKSVKLYSEDHPKGMEQVDSVKPANFDKFLCTVDGKIAQECGPLALMQASLALNGFCPSGNVIAAFWLVVTKSGSLSFHFAAIRASIN